MNADFKTVIAATDPERRDLFLGAAARLGTAVQNVEKDFWVCWALDALFNGLPVGGPRLLFKGGTSLSKAFGLISRFSEDIDITVFRDDLGQGIEAADLEGLSGKKRRARLDAIRDACQSYIAGPLTTQFTEVAATAIPGMRFRLEAERDDKDGQTLLFWYPAVTATEGDYIRAAVKIEAGAKSALDPHITTAVTPYVAADLPDLKLVVPNVTTVRPERTFWDKVIILHGLRQWYDHRKELRHEGQRVSRHYYDIHRLMQAEGAADWQADHRLAADCATHARLFFGSPDLGLDSAAAGTFTLTPDAAMHDALGRDYAAMSGMIFGEIPSLDAVLANVAALQEAINVAAAQPASRLPLRQPTRGDALKAELLRCAVLHADETPVATLAPGTGKTHRSYLWAYAAGEFEALKAVVYDFTPSRAGEHARRFLGGWQGSLVCDDFAGYKASFAQGVIEVGCMAHARRKFVELHLANKSHIAATPLALIGQLYDIERDLKDKPPAIRLAQRQARAAPMAAKLHEWLVLHRIKVPDGTAIAKAIDYSLNRWVALTRYLADPALPIDNNHDEQQIRPWATGRNYVQSAIMLSRRQSGLNWQPSTGLQAPVADFACA